MLVLVNGMGRHMASLLEKGLFDVDNRLKLGAQLSEAAREGSLVKKIEAYRNNNRVGVGYMAGNVHPALNGGGLSHAEEVSLAASLLLLWYLPGSDAGLGMPTERLDLGTGTGTALDIAVIAVSLSIVLYRTAPTVQCSTILYYALPMLYCISAVLYLYYTDIVQ
jgi:hypothetical protein